MTGEANEREMKTLWVVTELYFPEETSTGYYLTRIAEGLTGDFNVKALCGQPNYSARGNRAPARETRNKVQIFRCLGTTFNKNMIPLRLINILTLSISIFFKAFWYFKKNDQILVVTTPPSLPFIGGIVSLLRGARYTLLIHDNYPEILIAVNKTRLDSWLVKFLNYWNKMLYWRADKIIVVGRDMKQLVEKKLDGREIPIAVIPNWAELEQVEPKSRNENTLLKELGLTDKFVFLYAGNMGHPNDLESIVWCADQLKSETKMHFLFLGAGVKKKWLENQVRELSLGNITILEPRPRTDQTNFLNACDVSIISLVQNMLGVSMPSRTYNTLAVGKPIIGICDPQSELAMVIEEESVGWVVPPNEKETLLRTILTAYEARTEFDSILSRGRKSAVSKYSLAQALKKYQSFLTSDNIKCV